jgi:hypothetical protein
VEEINFAGTTDAESATSATGAGGGAGRVSVRAENAPGVPAPGAMVGTTSTESAGDPPGKLASDLPEADGDLIFRFGIAGRRALAGSGCLVSAALVRCRTFCESNGAGLVTPADAATTGSAECAGVSSATGLETEEGWGPVLASVDLGDAWLVTATGCVGADEFA